MNQTLSAFDIKSTHIDILSLSFRTGCLDDILQTIHARFAQHTAQDQKEAFVIDITLLDAPHEVDLKTIMQHLQSYGVQIIALRHPDPRFAKLAQQFNLVWLPPVLTRPTVPGNSHITETQTPSSKLVAPNALVIDRPVRAGQQIYAKGSDLVVLAMVSAGAEVIADGSIHIYAPLRGKALAGAHGNTAARIFTRSMEAELVSIAGVYRTVEHGLPESISSKPTQIYLENERIVMAALNE